MTAGDQSTTSESTSSKNSRPTPGKDSLWLVKSGDQVLGPMNTGEVIRLLRAKELVVIDEVIAPQSRWRHIRDEAIFAPVVEEIRTGLMTVRDDTEVDGLGEGGTPTVTAHADADELTPILDEHSVVQGHATQARFDSSINVSRISDAEVVSETEEREMIHHASAREIERPTPSGKNNLRDGGEKRNIHSTLAYTPPGSKKKKAKRDSSNLVSKTSRVLWVIVGVVVAVILTSVYIFNIAPARRAGLRSGNLAHVRLEADRAWQRAEFARALKLYDQINRESRPDLKVDFETTLRQAILKLRIEREALSAKRALEALIPKLPTTEAKARGRVALAVAQLQSEQPEEARAALEELVRDSDAGPVAFFNLAAAQTATGKNEAAIETLKKLENHPTLATPARLLRILVHLKKGESKLAAEVANEADDVKNLAAWRQEVFAMGAVADWSAGDKRRSNQKLRLALDADPFQTEEFFYDPLLYFEALRWREFLPHVKEHADRVKTNSARALHGLALVKADRRAEAQSLIAESLTTRSGDVDLQAVNAFSLMMQGRDDEARGTLRFTKLSRTGRDTGRDQDKRVPMISAILEARLCERAGDQNCADTVWSELAKRENPPVAALVSVARVDSQIATEQGAASVERLKVLYPNSVLVTR
ncbi:MAG: hypothetical protein RBT63_01910, partial [Bdellovibrionales bacterium]|nr:hypothetical protein [Bdellovibrionales bacterium]